MIVPARNARSFQMKRLYIVAFAAGLVASLPASLQAQTTTDTPASASTAPPAASPSPAASPAPAASPSASAPPADTPSNDAPRKKTAAKQKTKSLPKAMTQQEIDHSVESGTVPSRYRKNVPKEYQQYVPFEKQ
jgi:hypothetical protein